MKLNNFTPRKPQVEYFDALEKGELADRTAVVAKCGSGKSLIVLEHAMRLIDEGKRVLIVTPTNALAQQYNNEIKTRDLPIRSLFGRSHYACNSATAADFAATGIPNEYDNPDVRAWDLCAHNSPCLVSVYRKWLAEKRISVCTSTVWLQPKLFRLLGSFDHVFIDEAHQFIDGVLSASTLPKFRKKELQRAQEDQELSNMHTAIENISKAIDDIRTEKIFDDVKQTVAKALRGTGLPYSELVARCEEEVKADPDKSEMWTARGRVFLSLKQLEDSASVADFERNATNLALRITKSNGCEVLEKSILAALLARLNNTPKVTLLSGTFSSIHRKLLSRADVSLIELTDPLAEAKNAVRREFVRAQPPTSRWRSMPSWSTETALEHVCKEIRTRQLPHSATLFYTFTKKGTEKVAEALASRGINVTVARSAHDVAQYASYGWRNSVLVGNKLTSTGLDLPCNKLTAVYICQRPLPPAGISNTVIKREFGLANFWEPSQASSELEIEQVASRLIRTPEDTGEIVVLTPNLSKSECEIIEKL